jgi:hypothetical protein
VLLCDLVHFVAQKFNMLEVSPGDGCDESLSQRCRERAGSDRRTSRDFYSALKLLSAYFTGVASEDSLARGPPDATKFGSIITL